MDVVVVSKDSVSVLPRSAWEHQLGFAKPNIAVIINLFPLKYTPKGHGAPCPYN
jgi:hypothetical protein